MQILSPAYPNNGTIPMLYSCDGENINPPLSISGVSSNAKSLAIVMYDPDVPVSLRADGNWDHWIVWNIDPSIDQISENAQSIGVVGKNTSGENKYTGPCPPDREHRYFIDLYSLDTILNLAEGSSRSQLEKAINGHILQKATLMGRYNRA